MINISVGNYLNAVHNFIWKALSVLCDWQVEGEKNKNKYALDLFNLRNYKLSTKLRKVSHCAQLLYKLSARRMAECLLHVRLHLKCILIANDNAAYCIYVHQVFIDSIVLYATRIFLL